MRFLRLLAPFVALSALQSGALADPLGTAGPWAVLRFESCGVSQKEQDAGACDPVPVASDLPANDRSAALLLRAKRLLVFGRTTKAMADSEAAVRADPKNVSALVFAARFTLTNGNGTAAQRHLAAARLVDPEHPYANATLAHLMTNAGDTRTALRLADDAIRARPDDADIRWIRAQVFVSLNQPERALEDLDRSLSIEPDRARTRILRIGVLTGLGRNAEALEDIEHALARTPRDTTLLYQRATARMELGDDVRALADLTAALDVPGRLRSAMLHGARYRQIEMMRAMLLVRANRTEEAMKAIDAILSTGNVQAILRLQLHLRNEGLRDTPLDGKRSAALDDALKLCFAKAACGRGILRRA